LSEHLLLTVAEGTGGVRHVHICLCSLKLSNNNIGAQGALTLGKALRCLPCLAGSAL